MVVRLRYTRVTPEETIAAVSQLDAPPKRKRGRPRKNG
jgi:hypothetical protein